MDMPHFKTEDEPNALREQERQRFKREFCKHHGVPESFLDGPATTKGLYEQPEPSDEPHIVQGQK